MQEQQPKKEKPKLNILDAVQSPYGLISKYEATYYDNKFEYYVNPNIMDEDTFDKALHAQRYIDLLTISNLPGFQKQYEAQNTTLEQEFSRGKQLFLDELNNKMPRSELRNHTLYPLILQSVLKDIYSVHKKVSE